MGGVSFDFYIDTDSWLHRADPRTKMLLVVCLVTLLLLSKNLFFIMAMLAAIHLLLFSAHVPAGKLIWVWKLMLPVMIMIAFFWPLFYREGRLLLAFWIIRITSGALITGAAMALRITALGFAFFILLFTTGQTQLVRGMEKIGLPYKAGLIFSLTLRFLPTIFGMIQMVIDAQKARGLNLRSGSWFRRLRALQPILVAVIITGLRTSDNLARALETRGFGREGRKRTFYHDLRFRPMDSACSVAIIVGTVAILVCGLY
ncbi:MAG: energy-coupling factor transporter transmembrane protein EcfT [Sporolactobacillus sp.]|jgi:energy-coupling factor transport system permease protein|nr:energy-coupling factor transporter transmembrane protein EcfT [Sporolactobacillus sp.]